MPLLPCDASNIISIFVDPVVTNFGFEDITCANRSVILNSIQQIEINNVFLICIVFEINMIIKKATKEFLLWLFIMHEIYTYNAIITVFIVNVLT